MAKDNQTTPAAKAEVPAQLFSVGAPVVVASDGSRVQLGGELSAEHRKQLGDNKIRSLMTAGHLQTQEQIDQAERVRQDINSRRPPAGFINPNFGTPSMTPEAAEKFGAPVLAQGARQDESELGDTGQRGNAAGSGSNDSPPGSGEQTSVSDLGLESRIVDSLNAAGLKTVADVLRYGEDNDGLTGIEGIGEASEEKIQAAIDKVLPSAD